MNTPQSETPQPETAINKAVVDLLIASAFVVMKHQSTGTLPELYAKAKDASEKMQKAMDFVTIGEESISVEMLVLMALAAASGIRANGILDSIVFNLSKGDLKKAVTVADNMSNVVGIIQLVGDMLCHSLLDESGKSLQFKDKGEELYTFEEFKDRFFTNLQNILDDTASIKE